MSNEHVFLGSPPLPLQDVPPSPHAQLREARAQGDGGQGLDGEEEGPHADGHLLSPGQDPEGGARHEVLRPRRGDQQGALHEVQRVQDVKGKKLFEVKFED